MSSSNKETKVSWMPETSTYPSKYSLPMAYAAKNDHLNQGKNLSTITLPRAVTTMTGYRVSNNEREIGS